MSAWTAPHSVTAPSLWGKLPSSPEFLQHALPAVLKHHWSNWFHMQTHKAPWLMIKSQNADNYLKKHLPLCFYFPTCTFHEEQTIPMFGVMAWSCDKVGREHPFIMNQLISPQWLEENNILQARKNWLFWYSQVLLHFLDLPSRAPASAIKATGDSHLNWSTLVEVTDELWSLYGKHITQPNGDNQFEMACLKIIAKLTKDRPIFAKAPLSPGVAVFPLAKVQKLDAQLSEPVFWRQNAFGYYTAASRDIVDLWPRAALQETQL